MFHGMDKDHDQYLTFAKDRDKALSKAGPKLVQAVLPGLSSSVHTTGPESSEGSFSYQHLLVSGRKATPCSVGLFSTTGERLQYVHDVAVAQRVLDQSKLSPFLFLDSRNIDKLTKKSINLAPCSKDVTIVYESFQNSDLQFHIF